MSEEAARVIADGLRHLGTGIAWAGFWIGALLTIKVVIDRE